MSDKKDIKEFESDTESVITSTLNGLVEGLTGVSTSSKNDLILSVSHTFQRMRGGQFLSALRDEWNNYREKGKIKNDYQYTEQHKVCLQELLEFLDKDSPDEVRFTVLKQIFLVAASEEASDRNNILPQQFMKIARSLTDGEILILSTIWRIFQDGCWDKDNKAADKWLQEVTTASGMHHKELVEIHEQGLMDKKLLTPRIHGDRSGVIIGQYYRLSGLGYELCSYIYKYEK